MAVLLKSSLVPLPLPFSLIFLLFGGYGGRIDRAAVNDRDVDDDNDDVLGLFREFDSIGVSGGDQGLQLSSFRSSSGRTRSTAVIARWTLRFELSALRCWRAGVRRVGCRRGGFDVEYLKR